MYLHGMCWSCCTSKSEADPGLTNMRLLTTAVEATGRCNGHGQSMRELLVVYPEQWNLALISDCYGGPVGALHGV